jgi:hypothetical protein
MLSPSPSDDLIGAWQSGLVLAGALVLALALELTAYYRKK